MIFSLNYSYNNLLFIEKHTVEFFHTNSAFSFNTTFNPLFWLIIGFPDLFSFAMFLQGDVKLVFRDYDWGANVGEDWWISFVKYKHVIDTFVEYNKLIPCSWIEVS